jgi:replicative DNA helicase
MEFLNVELPDSGLVLVAGRPGMGKSYINMHFAKALYEMNKNCVLLMADGKKAYPCASYNGGKTKFYPSELQCAVKLCPQISFVIEDDALHFTEIGWKELIEDIIKHQKPNVIFINCISEPLKKVDTKIIKMLQKVAQKSKVLIVAEINVKRRLDSKKDHRPTKASVMCRKRALKYVDEIMFVYRENYYTDIENQASLELSNFTVYNKNKTSR